MKKIIFLMVLPVAVIFACGEDKKTEEVVTLETFKDKLSYAMGAANALSFANDPSGQTQKLDLELVASGFASNLNANDADACRETLRKLFGPNFDQFDSTYIKEGSECIGKLTAAELYRQMKDVDQLDKFDMKKVAIGFRHGIMKTDTLLKQEEKDKLLQDFVAEVTAQQQAKMAALDGPFLEQAKSRPNTKVIDGGIVIETIKAGTGGSPTMYDDFEAHYILTNPKGDTLESSFDRGQTLKMNLQSVIPGWTMSFPQFKKGGKYRVFIPSDYAYKQGALCFYIEFVNFGKAGSIATPPPTQQGGAPF